MQKKLILVELNEINFDLAQRYIEENPGCYPGFEKLLLSRSISTSAESAYEEIEPWIQWVSVHTGLDYSQHQVFRLGDIVNSDANQIFETLEAHQLSVGGVSAMNAANRLQQPAYFIPDPWTETPSDGSWWSRNLTSAISQAVNDNAQAKITLRNLWVLGLGLLRFVPFRRFGKFISLAIASRKSSWLKALFLDLFLHQIHLDLFANKQPNFSTIFFNAGAHIQHHYFFNSLPVREDAKLRNPSWYVNQNADPIADMLKVYDLILRDYLDMEGVQLIIATGLKQVPYDRVKFYYRLRDHANFLKLLGVKFKNVSPRMTRDFVISFDTEKDTESAAQALESIRVKNSDESLFGVVDVRDSLSIFATLTYPDEIGPQTQIRTNDDVIELYEHVTFVAIKNGMHHSKGYAFFSKELERFVPEDSSHVCRLHNTMLQYFGVKSQS